MTAIQEQAIQLIQKLPDSKIQAIITLATDELMLMELREQNHLEQKKQAFEALESMNLTFPDDFDADAELEAAMEEKYGRIG